MTRRNRLVTIVPGTIRFGDATRADYPRVARHHYRARRPATFCRCRGAWHVDPHTGERRLVAVAVLSWPVPMLRARLRHFGVPRGYRAALAFANGHVRTISRVIVHPQFRALGLARALVGQLIDRCPTRLVEASATMGDFVGCFAANGMTRVPTPPGEPAYFVIEKAVRPTPPTRAPPRSVARAEPKKRPRTTSAT